MGRQIDAHQVAFLVEPLDVAPTHVRLGNGRRGNLHVVETAKERVLGFGLRLLVVLAVAHQCIKELLALGILREIGFAPDAKGVEAATQSQRLESLAVDIAQVDTLGKVEDVLIGAVLLPLLNNAVGGTVAHALDGCQTEAYLAVVVHTELQVRLVDVGPQRGDAHLLALVHELGDLRNLVAAARHDGGHELGRIVGLEVGRLVGHPRIAGGVRLVEGVGGELLPVGPDLLQYLRVVAVSFAALDELGLHGVDDLNLLLTHGLTQGVALAAGEVGQLSREQHHLLLVDGDAVGVLQPLLHQRMVVDHFLAALLAVDEVGDVLHRPGTVERVHRHEIRKPLGLERPEPLLHPVRLELEKPGRLAAAEELVGLAVVVRNPVRVEPPVSAPQRLRHARVPRPEQVDALLLDGERLEPEEVHLQEPDRFDEMAVVLGGEQLVALCRGGIGLLLAALLRRGHHRQRLDERIARDEDAAGMDARLADRPLQPRRALHKLVDDGVARVERRLQVGRRLARLLEVDLRHVGDVGGELVRVRQRIVHHPPDVLDRAFRGHLAEGDDVRHVVGAVLPRHVFDHALAPGVVEIDVYIGHGDAVGVEEPLEEEVELDRVDVGDAEGVGHGRARRRAAPGAYPHAALLARGADVVGDDQEVPRKAHGADRIELELNALVDLLRDPVRPEFPVPLPPPLLRPLPDERGEVLGLELNAHDLVVAAELLDAPLRVHARERRLVVLPPHVLLGAEGGGDVELRHDRVGVELVLLHPVRDGQGVADQLRVLGEEPAHVLLGLEPLLAGVDHALRVAHLRAGRERQKDVVGVVVVLVEEVDVVGGNDADAELPAELQHAPDDPELAVVQIGELAARGDRNVVAGLRRAMQHHLERVVVAEKLLVPLRHALGPGHVALVDRMGDLARDARRRAVQPLVVLLQQRVVDSRVVVEAVDMRERHELDEVVVALPVLRVQAEVEAALALVARQVVAGGGDIGLAAENRLYMHAREIPVDLLLRRPTLVVEALEREKVAVVGDGERRHPELARALDERHDLALPVQHRIGGVQMEMDEVGHVRIIA